MPLGGTRGVVETVHVYVLAGFLEGKRGRGKDGEVKGQRTVIIRAPARAPEGQRRVGEV